MEIEVQTRKTKEEDRMKVGRMIVRPGTTIVLLGVLKVTVPPDGELIIQRCILENV